MATLSDIDTTTTGWIAYWNAIDQGGVASIDPTEALTDGSIQQYTLYDNGFEADYSLGLNAGSRTVKVRVKEDGWIVAYMGRGDTFGADQTSHPQGTWDIINDWTYWGTGSVDTNTLERCVNSLKSQFSNAGSMTYNVADVGLYNYEHTSATTITNLSRADRGYSQPDEVETNLGFSYTSDTTRHYHVGVAWGGGGDSPTFQSVFEGTDIVNASNVASTRWGALDILGGALASSSGVEYQTYYHLYPDYQEYANLSTDCFVMWS